MTWSYNTNLLNTNPKDAVRLLIGDTQDCDKQMQDEEINYIYGIRGSLYGTAADCCRALAARFSRFVDQQAGTSKLFYSQMAKAYSTKAIEFDTKAAVFGSAMPYAGGISLSDKQRQDMDTDRVKPAFTKGMTDDQFPEASGPTETIEQFE